MQKVIIMVMMVLVVGGLAIWVRAIQGNTVPAKNIFTESIKDTVPYGGDIGDSILLDSALIEHSEIPDSLLAVRDTVLLRHTNESPLDTIIYIRSHGAEHAIDSFEIHYGKP